jgi:antitoxin component YwqK of YwqJK toxin-antitoxin module
MKNILLVIALLGSLCSCSQQEVIISESELPGYVFYLPGKITPYTGKCIMYFYGTTVVKEEMNFKKGILDGPYTSYYADGSVKRKGGYRNGKFHGSWEYWSNEGNKSYEVFFINDSLQGQYITYFPSGKLHEQGAYKKNYPYGTWSVYDESGKLLEKRSY